MAFSPTPREKSLLLKLLWHPMQSAKKHWNILAFPVLFRVPMYVCVYICIYLLKNPIWLCWACSSVSFTLGICSCLILEGVRFERGAALCWTPYVLRAKSIIDFICYEWNNLDVSGKWEEEEWGGKQMNVSCHVFQCSNFLACFYSWLLWYYTWCVFCAAGFKAPCPVRLHKDHCHSLWSQNEAVDCFGHFISVVWRRNTINLEGRGKVQKEMFIKKKRFQHQYLCL